VIGVAGNVRTDAPLEAADAEQQLVGGSAAVGGDLDQHAAPVAGVGDAVDPAGVFEEIEHGCHGGRRNQNPEAYAEYVEDEPGDVTLAELSGRPNVISTRTFSKLYGLPAPRVGYAVAEPALIRRLAALRAPAHGQPAGARSGHCRLSAMTPR
jgi:Aminotransferase class I and II